MVTENRREFERRKAISITLQRDVLEQLKEIAWQKRTNPSRLVNEVMAEWLAAQEESNKSTANTAVISVGR